MDYKPKPGSIAAKVLAYFESNPGEELTLEDIAVKFDLQINKGLIRTAISTAVSKGLITWYTDNKGQVIYTSGKPANLAPVVQVVEDLEPLQTQVGGTHYTKLSIQPMEFSMKNNLDACQHSIIEYVVQFRDKNGIEDLLKARHTLDMLIAYEEKMEAEKNRSIITPEVRKRMK